MNHKESAKLRKLATERGGSVQGDVTVSDSPDHIRRPPKKVKPVSDKKPKKKLLSISNEHTKGTIVCMENNEAVKYWR